MTLVGLGAVLFSPAMAHAQGQSASAFENCKSAGVENTLATGSISLGDPEKGILIAGTGKLIVRCDDTTIYADELEVSDKDRKVRARGNITFEQPGLRITAAAMELDRVTQLGYFLEADGTARIAAKRNEPRSLFGTQEPEVHFWARRLERVGDKKYEIDKGGFSTCMQPTERWTVDGSRLTIVLDDYVLLRNAVMNVKGVPIFYLPVMYYPLGEDDRSTGFLLPTYTSSSAQGTGLSNAFFWAINRSQDATLYHTWYSRAGQSFGGEYRYVSAPGSDGQLMLNLIDQPTGTDLVTRREFSMRGNINQALPRGFRVIGRTYYFSSIITQQTYEQNLYDLSQRSRDFDISLFGNVGRYRFETIARQNDVFDVRNNLEVINRRGETPLVRVTAQDRPIGRSRVYFGAIADATRFVRHNDISNPDNYLGLWRVDALPTIRAPLSNWPFLSVSTAASWRLTHWTQRRDITLPNAPRIDASMTRQLLELRGEVVGPVFSRVFTASPTNNYAERFKHLIEPRVMVQYFSPFDRRSEVIEIDGVDQLVGGTTAVTYALTNRLLARRKLPNGASDVREILTVALSQNYYTNAAAAAADPDNVRPTATPFQPLILAVAATPVDGVRGDFRMEIDPEFKRPREYRASATVIRGLTQVNAAWSKLQEIPGVISEAQTSHFLNAGGAVSDSMRRLGGRYDMYFDVKRRAFVQDRLLVYYNTQCCGIAVDFVNTRRGVAAFQQSNRTLNLMFTLAGIGTFANPFGAFGNNTPR